MWIKECVCIHKWRNKIKNELNMYGHELQFTTTTIYCRVPSACWFLVGLCFRFRCPLFLPWPCCCCCCCNCLLAPLGRPSRFFCFPSLFFLPPWRCFLFPPFTGANSSSVLGLGFCFFCCFCFRGRLVDDGLWWDSSCVCSGTGVWPFSLFLFFLARRFCSFRCSRVNVSRRSRLTTVSSSSLLSFFSTATAAISTGGSSVEGFSPRLGIFCMYEIGPLGASGVALSSPCFESESCESDLMSSKPQSSSSLSKSSIVVSFVVSSPSIGTDNTNEIKRAKQICRAI